MLPTLSAFMSIARRQAFFLFVTLIMLMGCESKSGPSVQQMSGPTMGTSYQIKWVEAQSETEFEELQSQVDALLEAINAQMSTYRPDSELSQLNQDQQGKWHQVSPELIYVLKESQKIHKLTAGAFDVTIGPLVNLWGFGPEPDPDDKPSAEEIQKAMQSVGMGAIKIESKRVRWTKPRYVDLSAIAKGYGVDAVANLLIDKGIKSFLVEIGGEIFAQGVKPDGSAWQIAIETPTYHQRGIQEILPLENMGMATSGDYRNYQEFNGKRFSHTLDPRTGNPVTHSLASVTVVANTTATADALATAILVMGEKEGLLFAETQNLPALLIVREGQGFKQIATKAYHRLKQSTAAVTQQISKEST